MNKFTHNKGLVGVFAAATLLFAAPMAYADPDLTVDDDAQPWYEAFTFAAEEDVAPGISLAETETQVEWNAGERWGFTLGLDSDPNTQVDFDGISASAFVDVGNRFRFQGTVRLTAPDELFVGPLEEERAPEVKFESALRF